MHFLTPVKKLATIPGLAVTSYSEFESLDFSTELQSYLSIRECNLLLVTCTVPLNQSALQKIIFAMELDKPIIMTDIPKIYTDVTLLEREIVTKRLNKLLIADIGKLDEEDLHSFIETSTKPTNYSLTKLERILSKSYRRSRLQSMARPPLPSPLNSVDS